MWKASVFYFSGGETENLFSVNILYLDEKNPQRLLFDGPNNLFGQNNASQILEALFCADQSGTNF